jgi:phage terminase Nu1 subunit (DNA packaging protein)
LPDLPGQDGPVHQQTVKKWEQAGMPVAERGRKGKPSKFDEAEVRAWLQARDEAARSGANLDVAQERARKEHWQALVAEQTYRTREKELLPRADAERAWAGEVAAVRTKLLSWSQTLADRVHRAATLEGVPGVERVLADAVREVLREMAGGAVEVPAKRKRSAA